MYRAHVLVCGGTGCSSAGSEDVLQAFNEELKKNDLSEEVCVVQTGCHGLCSVGPVVIVYPDSIFYTNITVKDVSEIVTEHLLKGRVVDRLVYQEGEEKKHIESLEDTVFYKKQFRIALRNCGVIDPENIEEYIGTGGYEALGKV